MAVIAAMVRTSARQGRSFVTVWLLLAFRPAPKAPAPAHQYPEAIVNRRPQLRIVAPDASPEEAAAVVAALEQFMRETAPRPVPEPPGPTPWQQAALHEAVSREPELPAPWAA